MIVAVGVKTGIKKEMCDDTAVVNDTIINDDYREIETGNINIIGVADGVGGISGGKQASLFVSKNIIQMVLNDTVDGLKEQLFDLNNSLISYASSATEHTQMATTFTALVVSAGKHFLIHIGNTRMYVGQGSYLKQYTQDHTTYQWLLSRGQTEAAESCNKNEIYSCLGGGNKDLINQIEVHQVFENEFPDCIVFTSDGVHEYVDIDRLEEIVFSGIPNLDIAKRVIDEAEANGSEDDKTIIILRKRA